MAKVDIGGHGGEGGVNARILWRSFMDGPLLDEATVARNVITSPTASLSLSFLHQSLLHHTSISSFQSLPMEDVPSCQSLHQLSFTVMSHTIQHKPPCKTSL